MRYIEKMNKIKEIYDKANDDERFGFPLALFPLWIKTEYNLTHEEIVELMKYREGERKEAV